MIWIWKGYEDLGELANVCREEMVVSSVCKFEIQCVYKCTRYVCVCVYKVYKCVYYEIIGQDEEDEVKRMFLRFCVGMQGTKSTHKYKDV